MEFSIGEAKLRLIQGDITKIPVDALVNAANSELAGGGGVDGAVHRAGGPSIMLDLNKARPRGGCPTGSAVVTRAGKLPAKNVIHAVGPIWRGGGFGEAELLVSAYETSLKLAAGLGAVSVSFPSLSTGAFGYPVDKAAPVALRTVSKFLKETPGSLREVVFVLFDAATLRVFERALKGLESA